MENFPKQFPRFSMSQNFLYCIAYLETSHVEVIFSDNSFLSGSTVQSGKSVITVSLGDFPGVCSINESSCDRTSVGWNSDTIDTNTFTVENRFDIDTWMGTKSLH